ncbi:hypothetical protein K402DRAFT_388773, partial [Aulographum hederae CBS 113979]
MSIGSHMVRASTQFLNNRIGIRINEVTRRKIDACGRLPYALLLLVKYVVGFLLCIAAADFFLPLKTPLLFDMALWLIALASSYISSLFTTANTLALAALVSGFLSMFFFPNAINGFLARYHLRAPVWTNLGTTLLIGWIGSDYFAQTGWRVFTGVAAGFSIGAQILDELALAG